MHSWDYWLDLEMWKFEEAVRLTICSNCTDMQECIDLSFKNLGDINWCPSHNQTIADTSRMIEMKWGHDSYIRTYGISPLEYIKWALTKRSIYLPQEMKDWYAQQKQQVSSRQKSPSANGGQTEAEPPHPGSARDSARIKATRQACDTVRAEIEQGEHGFQVSGKYKTNHAHFETAVQAILGGVKAHRKTVREEWEKVSVALKHSGRVPEQ